MKSSSSDCTAPRWYSYHRSLCSLTSGLPSSPPHRTDLTSLCTWGLSSAPNDVTHRVFLFPSPLSFTLFLLFFPSLFLFLSFNLYVHQNSLFCSFGSFVLLCRSGWNVDHHRITELSSPLGLSLFLLAVTSHMSHFASLNLDFFLIFL